MLTEKAVRQKARYSMPQTRKLIYMRIGIHEDNEKIKAKIELSLKINQRTENHYIHRKE